MDKLIVQHRRGTEEEWRTYGYVAPLEGELVIEIDEVNKVHKLKIGDGSTPYKDLKYLSAGDEDVIQHLSQVKPKVFEIKLSTLWEYDNGRPRQQVTVPTGIIITNKSRLDLQYNTDIVSEFKSKNIVLLTENHDGTMYIYSSEYLPQQPYVLQGSIVEVDTVAMTDNKIVGIPAVYPSSTGVSGSVVSDIAEEGTGNGWIYRKWTSGKCELHRSCSIVGSSNGTIELYTPFLVQNIIPFIVVTDGSALTTQTIECEEDIENNTTKIIFSFDASYITRVSVRIEGTWK